MVKKQNFVKNLLTNNLLTAKSVLATASAIAMLSAGAQTASAAALIVTGGNVALNAQVNWTQADGVTALGAVPATNSAIKFGGNHTINADAANFVITGIDLDGKNPGALTVNDDTSIGSIVDLKKSNHKLTIKFNADKTLTLTGTAESKFGSNIPANDYSALGAIDFKNQDATVEINADGVTIGADFSGDAAGLGDNGTININATDVTLSGTFEANNGKKVKNFQVQAGKSVTLDTNLVLAGDVTLGNQMTINDGKDVTVREIQGSAAAQGDLVFVGKSTVEAAVGNTQSLNLVKIGKDEVDFKGDAIGNDMKAKELLFTDAAGVAKFSTTDRDLTIEHIKAAENGYGKLVFDDTTKTYTINARIGESGKAIGELAFTNADNTNALKITTDESIYLNQITTDVAGKGHVQLKIAKDKKVVGYINTDKNTYGSATNYLNTFDVVGDETGVLGTTVGFENVGIFANEIDLAQGNDNTIHLHDNATFWAKNDINDTSDATVFVKGDAVMVAGNEINLNAPVTLDTAGKTLGMQAPNITLNGNALALDADATLYFGAYKDGKSVVPHVADASGYDGDIDFNEAITVKADNTGVVDASGINAGKTLNLTGQIGDLSNGNVKALKELRTVGANIKLNEESNINTVSFGGSAAKVILAAGKKTKVVALEDSEKGVFALAGDHTFVSGTRLGKEEMKADKITFAADDQSLTLENDVHLFANTMDAKTKGKNSLIIEGDAEIGVKIGATTAFGKIDITGKDKTVKFHEDVTLDNDQFVEMVDGSKAHFVGNVSGKYIGNAAATVRFTNESAVTSNIDWGVDGTNLTKVEFAGGDVVQKKAVYADELAFDGDADSTVTLEGHKLNSAKVTTTSKKGNQHLQFTVDQNVTGNIGSADNHLGSLIFKGDANEVNTDAFYANLASDGNNVNKVNITKATGLKNVGAKDKAFAEVTFVNDITVEDVYAKVTKVNNALTVKNVTGDTVELDNANGADLTVQTAGMLGANVTTSTNNKGVVTFGGKGSDQLIKIEKNLGTTDKMLEKLSFEKGAHVKLDADVHAKSTDLQNVTLDVSGGDRTVGGSVAWTDGSTIKLGQKTLNMSAGVSTMKDAVTIHATYTNDVETHGQMKLGDNATLNLNKAEVNIELDDKAVALPTDERKITIISGGSLKHTDSTFAVSHSNNAFVKWDVEAGNNSVVISQTNNAPAAAKELFKGLAENVQENVQSIVSPDNTDTKAQAFTSLLARLASTEEGKKVATEAVERMSNPVVATEAVADVSNMQMNVVNTRINGLNTMPLIAVAEGYGVAAGDDDSTMHGMWMSPYYSNTTQKLRKGVSGYKSTLFGATFGVDTQINEATTLGVAFSAGRSDIKHKDIKSGDKTKADTYAGFIYSSYSMTENWSASGMAFFASTNVKNNERAVSGINDANAATYTTNHSKYEVTSYGVDLNFAYNHNISEVAMVSPNVGVSYNRVSDNGRTSGDTSIKTKSLDRFYVNAGAKVSTVIEGEGMVVVPNINGGVKYDLNSKAQSLDVKFANTALSTRVNKPPRALYNVGFGVDMHTGSNLVLGGTFGVDIADKYSAYNGAATVRIKF